MFRLVAPAGSPISCGDLIRATRTRGDHSENKTVLTQKLTDLLGSQHYFFTNSGRTGLTLILKAMQAVASGNRTEVILPAYTCFSVAAAVVRAGLKIRLVDIVPETFDYDYHQLKEAVGADTLAILGCGLFGLLPDMKQLRLIAVKVGAFLIDDAAQSMGTKTTEGFSGTLGDAGFFSLDRGKNMTTYAGGIVMTGREDIATQLRFEIERLKPATLKDELMTMTKLGLYSQLLHPRLYWIPSSLPFLGLGETEFDTEFTMSQLSGFQLATAAQLIDHLENHNRLRQKNARQLAERLSGNSRFTIAGGPELKDTIYLRLPLICKDRKLRDRGLTALRKVGIAVSTMYPEVINKIPGLESHLSGQLTNFPGARRVVDGLLALPTHPYVTEADIVNTTNTLTDL